MTLDPGLKRTKTTDGSEQGQSSVSQSSVMWTHEPVTLFKDGKSSGVTAFRNDSRRGWRRERKYIPSHQYSMYVSCTGLALVDEMARAWLGSRNQTESDPVRRAVDSGLENRPEPGHRRLAPCQHRVRKL